MGGVETPSKAAVNGHSKQHVAVLAAGTAAGGEPGCESPLNTQQPRQVDAGAAPARTNGTAGAGTGSGQEHKTAPRAQPAKKTPVEMRSKAVFRALEK